MVSQALFPAAVQRAIDEGIIAGDNGRLLLWVRRAAPARGRRRRDRRAATPVLGDQLAGGRLPRHAAGRLQDGRHRPGAAADHADRRGRRDRRVRRDAGRRPVRRHAPGSSAPSSATSSSPSCCSPPPCRSAWSCWSACRCSSARLSLILRPLQRRQAAAARGVRPADHPRRRHRRRPARAARHRRRADLPAPLRGAVPAGARRGHPGGRDPGVAGRGPGAAARHLRRAGHLARRPVRPGRPDHRRASSWPSTATRRSSSSRCAPPPRSPTAPPAPTSARARSSGCCEVEPDTARRRRPGDRAGRRDAR